MALRKANAEIIASSESLAKELGCEFRYLSDRTKGFALFFKKKTHGDEGIGFRFSLTFPFRGTEYPSTASLQVYSKGQEVDSNIDADPRRITAFNDIEFILRRVNEYKVPEQPITTPTVHEGSLTVSYSELSDRLGGYNHDVEADSSGIKVLLYGENNEAPSVMLHFYESLDATDSSLPELNLISAERTTESNGWGSMTAPLSTEEITSFADLVNMVDNSLSPLDNKTRR